MGEFCGADLTNKLKTFSTAEEMFEYLSNNAEFDNPVVNYIVHKCITYMKPTEKFPIEGITDRKACKKACRQNLGKSVEFVHGIFQKIFKRITDEDLRFRIYQNPKKCYTYSFDEKTNKHNCKCIDKGYQIKVSSRLLEIINSQLINSKDNDLAEELEEENFGEISKVGSNFSFQKLGNLALYFGGYCSSTKKFIIKSDTKKTTK